MYWKPFWERPHLTSSSFPHVKHQPLLVCLRCRRLDVLRYRLPVSDGPTGGGAEPTGAGSDPALVRHAAADGLPRAPQQACRHLLLLLGGSYTRGTARKSQPDQVSFNSIVLRYCSTSTFHNRETICGKNKKKQAKACHK